MNYKEISNVLGISTKTFYNKYNGDTEYTLSEILKLLDFFNVSFDDLITKIRKGENENEKVREKDYSK